MRRFIRIIVTVAMLVLAAALAGRMIKTRPQAERVAPEVKPPQVETVIARSSARPIMISATGTVIPSRRLLLQPQVSGKVMAHHESLVPGGVIRAGEVLLRIDPRDYELAAIRQRTQMEKAEIELEMEAGRRSVAEEEWKLFGDEIAFSDEGRRLALRKPQERSAQIALESARTLVKEAELSVERTSITCPFNALIVEENIELGQLVTPQSHLATLVGTDEYWVQASLPQGSVAQLVFPEKGGGRGSRVHVIQDAGREVRIEREGRLLRLLGDLEPAGRMARVIIAVDDPLGRRSETAHPLLLGSFVRLAIEGRVEERVFTLPRVALRDGRTVWVVNDDSLLEVRAVQVEWGTREEVFITEGIVDGERIVTGSLPGAEDGMTVGLREDGD
jgi:RND family efflux transporter MFP subunit